MPYSRFDRGMTRRRFVYVVAGTMLLAGCARSALPVKDDNIDYYTCTMHPSVHSAVPGTCPICGMDLVPVYKSGMGAAAAAASDKPSEFTVSTDRQQMIGVTYVAVAKIPLRSTVRTVGIGAVDRLHNWDFVSRVEGYVQKLFVSSRGEAVKLGQPLLTIYSPELLATEQEFLSILSARDQAQKSGDSGALGNAEQLVQAARKRLELWNITDAQIDDLASSRQASDTLTLFSPFDGVVLDLKANQGAHVMPGDDLVDVADLSSLWVWADFYQEDLPLLKPGLPVTITSNAIPSEKISGKIAVVDSLINSVQRTVRVRIDVDNQSGRLLPDMYVNVALELDAGEGLAVPVSAVLPTGQHDIVFVDKGEGRLEPRFVELGRKYGDFYAVTSGLTEGERVVNSANFLIDAESRVQGALKSW